MKPKQLPTEFAINMVLDKIMIIQQSELGMVNSLNYFDEYSPCHIYMICKRPRITIDPTSFKVTKEFIELTFQIQRQNKFERKIYKFNNSSGGTNFILKSNYPYSFFHIESDGKKIYEAKAAPFLQAQPFTEDFLDLEILYIGQSYGVDGARTAPDRLKNHSTLQGIYAEAIQHNPDSEIWLLLTSFEQLNIAVMNGRMKLTEEETEQDYKRLISVGSILNNGEINEQQKINFTEAALIKYFQPPYNIEYKNTFPNPAHKTYAECYELDINSIAIELITDDLINCRLYSQSVTPNWMHFGTFLLHSPEERRSMFDVSTIIYPNS